MGFFFFFSQKNRVKDFREAIIKYLEAMMESQQQVCKLLPYREERVCSIFSGAPCTRKPVKIGCLSTLALKLSPLCHCLFHVHFHIAHSTCTPRLPTKIFA